MVKQVLTGDSFNFTIGDDPKGKNGRNGKNGNGNGKELPTEELKFRDVASGIHYLESFLKSPSNEVVVLFRNWVAEKFASQTDGAVVWRGTDGGDVDATTNRTPLTPILNKVTADLGWLQVNLHFEQFQRILHKWCGVQYEMRFRPPTVDTKEGRPDIIIRPRAGAQGK